MCTHFYTLSNSSIFRLFSRLSRRSITSRFKHPSFFGGSDLYDDIIGSEDIRNMCNRSSFVAVLDILCVNFSRNFLKSLFRDSWASSLNIPMGSNITEITSDPWISTLYTDAGIGYHGYSFIYKRSVSNA